MAATEGPPEQRIRRWLAQNGPVDVGLDAIEETWGLETLTAGDRRRIGRALDQAGVVCEPPLRRAGRRDKLHLSLADGPEPEPEPEPEQDPEQGPDPEPEPAPPRARDATDGAPALRLAPLALGLMVIGSLGPWAKSIFVVDYGLDRAGAVVIVLAAAAGLLLFAHARSGRGALLPIVAALAATAAVMVVVSDFRELLDDESLGPAWGLYVAFAGSAATIAIATLQLTRR
jgi:hypothetical protein